MNELKSDLTSRVPSADEIARIVAHSRKLRAKAMRDLARAVWSRITGHATAPKENMGQARHA